MKVKENPIRLITQFILLLVLAACGSRPAPRPSVAEPYEDDGFSGAEPEAQGISIPSSSQIAPSDVLDQVLFEGTGGGEGEKWCPCVYVEGDILVLEGFSSNESLRLVAYDEYQQNYGSYYAEWTVNVDSSGMLIIQLNGYVNNITFVAYNPYSGEQIGPRNRRVLPMDGAPSYSSYAEISFEIEEVNMRMSPGYSNKDDSTDVIAKIPAGETVKILGGPFSADGLNWWVISWNGLEGYVADHTGSGRTILVFNP